MDLKPPGAWRLCLGILTAAQIGAPHWLGAQTALPAPAHLAVVDGTAMLAHLNQFESASAGVPIVPGDRLETAVGRLELLFPDGSALDLDEYSAIELQSAGLLRLTKGRLLMTVAFPASGASADTYQIDTPAASVRTAGPGEYRVSLLQDSPARGVAAELAVARGFGTLATERGTTSVAAGERSVSREGEAPGSAELFNSARFDDFDRWSLARRDERAGDVRAAQHLPSELTVYSSSLDNSGAWQYEAPYGYVWYPAVVASWRPYYNGYWATVPLYGWTWIGFDAWAWPTHHYGRWGFSRNRWFWVPGSHWGPGWVSWAAAPGYVSWCPLGFDNRPVFALSIGAGTATGGWTVLPRAYLGVPLHVGHYAVPAKQLPVAMPFVAQAAAPPAPVLGAPRRSYSASQQAESRRPLAQPPAAAAIVPESSSRAAPRIPAQTAGPVVINRADRAAAIVPLERNTRTMDGSPQFRQPLAMQGWERGAPRTIVPWSAASPGTMAPAPSPRGSTAGTIAPVPAWSAPSIPVPRSITPVPPSSSLGVPRWSAPSIPVPSRAAPPAGSGSIGAAPPSATSQPGGAPAPVGRGSAGVPAMSGARGYGAAVPNAR